MSSVDRNELILALAIQMVYNIVPIEGGVMFKIENHKQRLEYVTGWVVDQNNNFVVAQQDGGSEVGDHLVNHGDHLGKQVGFFDAERVPALLQHASHHLRFDRLLFDWLGAKISMMTPTLFWLNL